uniref:Methylthioribose-1-phosphate isomerase n=1 Tax=Candidatus Kentrum sp. FW TaxID=2126338 RepID=A0A450T8M1_9GAMM|nr:MAG: methylthioribose-1-phosphate isomerase [Candidatus Kentron sp. FW]
MKNPNADLKDMNAPGESARSDRMPPHIWWSNGALHLLDQRVLPSRLETFICANVQEVEEAIRDMVVRGAPAIGITAAYGVVLAARERYRIHRALWREKVNEDITRLGMARPTAVNLAWALKRMSSFMTSLDMSNDPEPALLDEARRIHEEDIAGNLEMGRLGAALIEEPCAVVTHCNAGALAVGSYGTALGVIRRAFSEDKIRMVYADETRPWLQGTRLTAWELAQEGIPVHIMVDSACAHLMSSRQGARERIGWVIVGADRVAANGDVANKIGTYSLAINARYHGVKFMVAAPTSTIDMNTPDGKAIPIEVRSEREVLSLGPHPIAPEGVPAWNPVFDITPANLIDAIVTEMGVIEAPNSEKVAAIMAKTRRSFASNR